MPMSRNVSPARAIIINLSFDVIFKSQTLALEGVHQRGKRNASRRKKALGD
jgi:hypothetical protein